MAKTPSPSRLALCASLLTLSNLASVAVAVADATTAATALSFAKSLGTGLSPDAAIWLPGSSGFANVTDRWSLYDELTYSIAVEVATAADVQLVVKYANLFKIPFLATGGTHGSITSLGKLNYGVDISMRKLNSIVVNSDGKTATMGGGVIAKNVTDALFKKGKYTVTGTCECLSLMGPTLGGGQGWLEGRYGLALDQIVEAQVVLADGSLVTASSSSNSDLVSFTPFIRLPPLWALKGAGHNFGIVTQVKYKIYDVPKNDIWTVGTYYYTASQFTAVFNLINQFTADGAQAPGLMIWSNFFQDPTHDVNNAVIQIELINQASLAASAPFTSVFAALKPIDSLVVTAPFTQLSELTEQGIDQWPCFHLETRGPRFVVNAKKYNVTATKLAYDIFNKATKVAGMENSLFLADAYAAQGPLSIEAESTAYPDRANILHLSAVFIYSDPALDAVAISAGKALRKVLIDGLGGSIPFNAYVNYAYGDESVEEIYGHEAWRIAKLRSLKAKYDPGNRFRFYGPVVGS